MDHCYGLPTPTKVETPLGTDANGYEAKRDWTNSDASFIGMMLYLASNKITDIYYAIHQCYQFTHNTNSSHEMAVNRICWYIQGTKDNGLVFNTSKKRVVEYYAGADCSGL